MTVITYALDVSISMAKSYSNFVPNKLSVAIESILMAGKRAIESGYRVGLVVFAEWAMPLVYPTRNISHFLSGLRVLGRTFIGSAPGDAITESVKIMRVLPDEYKIVSLITDGDYNMGVPIEYAISYAVVSNVRLDVFHIGDIESSQLSDVYKKYREKAKWIQVNTKEELASALIKQLGGIK